MLYFSFHLDPTFTRENVSKVIATLKDEAVAFVLNVPVDMQIDFQKQSFSSGDFDYRRRLIDYFMRYSHYANWSEISSRLYREEHHEADFAARVFDSRMPGKLARHYACKVQKHCISALLTYFIFRSLSHSRECQSTVSECKSVLGCD